MAEEGQDEAGGRGRRERNRGSGIKEEHVFINSDKKPHLLHYLGLTTHLHLIDFMNTRMNTRMISLNNIPEI